MDEARLEEAELEEVLRGAQAEARRRALELRREILAPDIKEQRTGPEQRQLGYAAGCNLFATLEPADGSLSVDLWVGPDARSEAEAAGWTPHPHPLRAKFGWVHRALSADAPMATVSRWIETARAHARRQPQR